MKRQTKLSVFQKMRDALCKGLVYPFAQQRRSVDAVTRRQAARAALKRDDYV